MKKNELLSKEEFLKFLTDNRKLINLHTIASDDYISYRCLYLNEMLNQAYVLAEQAIEKQLKLILLSINPEENIRKYNNHKIEKLINRIQSLSDKGLNKFLILAIRLSETYEMFRYPDNKIGSINYSWGGNEIEEIDEFFFYLIDISPLPEEVLFRTGLMVSIFENMFISQPKYYVTHRNISYRKRHNNLTARFHKVRMHFYPSLYAIK